MTEMNLAKGEVFPGVRGGLTMKGTDKLERAREGNIHFNALNVHGDEARPFPGSCMLFE